MDLESIQIPFPDEESVDKTNELTENLSKETEESMNVPNKSGDIYGGLSIEYMVSVWGKDKTIEYLDSTADLYNTMGMKDQANNVKESSQKLKYSNLKNNLENSKKQKLNKAKKAGKDIGNKLKVNAERAFAKADSVNKKLSGFTESRRRDIQCVIALINAVPTQEDLVNFIMDYLGGVTLPKITKKIDEKVDPLIKDIKPWADVVFSLYEMGKGISMDNVLDVVKELVTIQFYPFISKYKQYQSTLRELKNLVTELQLIVDAVNSKAGELGVPVTLVTPEIPELPELPDLPI